MIHIVGHAVTGILAQVYPTAIPIPSVFPTTGGGPYPVPSIPTTQTFTFNPTFFLFGGILFGLIGLAIWRSKGGSPIIGFLWGFFLGIIGVIVVAIAKPKDYRKVPDMATAQTQTWQAQQAAQTAAATPSRPCPHCSRLMQADQNTCPNCHQMSEPWRNQGGFWITKQDGKEWWLNPQTNAWQMYRINKYCPNCLAEMQPADGTCPECGTVSNALTAPTG